MGQTYITSSQFIPGSSVGAQSGALQLARLSGVTGSFLIGWQAGALFNYVG